MLGGPGTRRSDRSRVRGTIHQPSGRVRKIRDDVQRACFTWSHAYSRVLAGEYAPPPAFHLLRNAEQRQIVGGADAKVPRLMARFRLLRGVLSWPERVDRHICGTDRRTRWDGSVVKERPHDWRRATGEKLDVCIDGASQEHACCRYEGCARSRSAAPSDAPASVARGAGSAVMRRHPPANRAVAGVGQAASCNDPWLRHDGRHVQDDAHESLLSSCVAGACARISRWM
jgi:hypothetical protein